MSQPANSINDTYSTRQAADLLGISVRAAQLWVEQGKLQAWKTPGGHRRILRQSLESMLDNRRQSSGTPTLSSVSFEVLVVEDDLVHRHLYEQALQKLAPNLHLRTANGGIEGLICIGERQPSVLITDLMMPGVDGFQMLEALRSGTLVQPMEIIVATSLDDDEICAHGGLPSGITVFHKPVPIARLVRLVEAYRDIWAIQEGT